VLEIVMVLWEYVSGDAQVIAGVFASSLGGVRPPTPSS
jgi:hypothetical protein